MEKDVGAGTGPNPQTFCLQRTLLTLGNINIPSYCAKVIQDLMGTYCLN